MKQSILALIKDPLQQIGIKVDEILYKVENKQQFLRIIVDKEPNIDLDDCVAATKIINPLLDKVEFLPEKYILDVCSKVKGE